MSIAWETTTEDVGAVFEDSFGIDPSYIKLDKVHDILDHDEIERCALYGDDIDDQLELAHKEIRRQLIDNDWIPKVN